MGSKNKKIKVCVSNDELDALEDFLTIDFRGDEEKREKYRRKSLSIWSKLVHEFDKD